MNTRALSTLAAVATSGLLLVGAGMPAQAANASSTLGKVPATVTAASDSSYVKVPLTYRCTNNSKTTHYVKALLNQDGPWGWDLAYVAGYRGDTGGTVKAKCTGKTVTHVLRVKVGAYSNPEATLSKGAGRLSVELERRGAGSQGSYHLISTIAKDGTTTVR